MGRGTPAGKQDAPPVDGGESLDAFLGERRKLGVKGVRFSLVTASARILPLLMPGITGCASENIIGIWPPIKSAIDCAPLCSRPLHLDARDALEHLAREVRHAARTAGRRR